MKKLLSMVLSLVMIVSAVLPQLAFASESGDSGQDEGEYYFSGMDDPDLVDYLEEDITGDLTEQWSDGEYTLQDIEAVYYTQEYIEESLYNSRANVFFGYNLEEVDEYFGDTPYVFTQGNDGATVVKTFEDYDDTYQKIIRNVAIGTGVILITVVVTIATEGADIPPAVSFIIAASAKSARDMAISGAAISALISGVCTGVATGDVKETLEAAALSGSEGFMWGAISGAATGAATSALLLKAATTAGLTMDEVATILAEHPNLPVKFLKQISTVEQYEEYVAVAETTGLTIEKLAQISISTGYPLEVLQLVRSGDEIMIYYEQANLYVAEIDGEIALIRNIDPNTLSELSGKTVTNLERMAQGYAPVDAAGNAYELHHIGQSVDSPLAILTHAEHYENGNYSILHDTSIANGQGVHALESGSEWGAQRSAFWKSYAADLSAKIARAAA